MLINVKTLSLLLVWLLSVPTLSHAVQSLTYDGKVVSQMTRPLSLPFAVVVDELFVGIGESVRTGQPLVRYHLEPRDARAIQTELLTGGALLDIQAQLDALNQELLGAGVVARSSAALAARQLGSSEEASKNAQNLKLLRQRKQSIEQKYHAFEKDFAFRLAELESYFGVPLKRGEVLPQQLFLKAPQDGTVVDISPRLRANGRLDPHVAGITLADINPIQIQIQIYETELAKVFVGQEVTVDFVNMSGVKRKGKISMLSWQPIDPNVAVPSFYFAYIDVENKDFTIKPGYKVVVTIEYQE